MSRAAWTLRVLLSHWRAHPMQLATLVIGLMAATALWSGVQALNQQARISYDRAAAMFDGARTASLVPRDGATVPQSLFAKLRRSGWPVSPLIEGRVQLGGRSVRLIGIDPVTLPVEAGMMAETGRGAMTDFVMPPGQLLMARETLQASGLTEGARVTLQNGVVLPPLAARDRIAPGLAVADIGAAQRALSKPDQISQLLVANKASPREPLESIAGNTLQLVAADEESDLARLTDSFHLNLTAFGLLSFLVGLFIVNSAVGLAFEQRLPTIRTLRACGVSATALNTTLVAELVLIALVAGMAGLAGGYFIASFLLADVAASLRGLYGAEVPGSLSLQPIWWLTGMAMSVAGTLAAAAASFVKLNRVSLLESAQPQAWRREQQTWLWRQGAVSVAIGVAAVAAAFAGSSLAAGFFVLAGILLSAALALPALIGIVLAVGSMLTKRPLARWALADSRQQLSGLSLALMALLLAVAVNVGVGTMVGSFRETFTGWLDGRLAAEIYASAASDAQAADIKAWLGKRPERIAILSGARTDTQLNGAPLELLGLSDHATYRETWPLLEASPRAWDELHSGNAAFVSEQLSRRNGIGLGDNIAIPTATGIWQLRVAAIYADYGNPKGQLTVSAPALIAHFPQAPQNRFGLRVASEDVPRLIADMQSAFNLSDRQIADQAAVKTESKRIFERTFAVTSALNAFTLGVAGIALLTSMLTLANARLPQLAPLWAMGLTLRQLSLLELAKTMAMAFVTALFAIPLGILVGWCLVAIVNVKAFGWKLPLHVFPMQLLLLLGVAMLAAAIATVLPMLKLMRMPPARLVKIFAQER